MNLAVENYLYSITHRPIHVLFAPTFAFQKVDSPGIYINTKHILERAEPNTKVSKMLHPDIFYEIFQRSLKKLAQDGCYPEEICYQFCNFRISCSVADLPAYNLITPVINSFNGDLESFIQTFKKLL